MSENDSHIRNMSFYSYICYIVGISDHISVLLAHKQYMLCGVWNSDGQTFEIEVREVRTLFRKYLMPL
jgi:hypothetical protein